MEVVGRGILPVTRWETDASSATDNAWAVDA